MLIGNILNRNSNHQKYSCLKKYFECLLFEAFIISKININIAPDMKKTHKTGFRCQVSGFRAYLKLTLKPDT
jgi:hypothetical protein